MANSPEALKLYLLKEIDPGDDEFYQIAAFTSVARAQRYIHQCHGRGPGYTLTLLDFGDDLYNT